MADAAGAEMTGAEMVLRALKDQGVEVIFGYPGGAVLPIYDAIFKQNAIRHILVRHEQAAVHAAEGYARSTGKVGCVLVTSGPGATNAVTGLTDALMDSIPLVCITGQVPTHLIGNDAFQECDTVGITRPCTKHNYLVRDVNDLARVLHEAFHIASSGRPGPVVVDIPKDVQFGTGTYRGPQTLLFIPLAQIIRNFELGYTPWSLILTYPTFLIPFCTWLMMGYFKSIPKELEECDRIDGASRWKAMVYIVIPVAVPGILSSGIIAFTLS